MNTEIALNVLKETLASNPSFSEMFDNLKFHGASGKYPRSIVVYYENASVGGEISIYLVSEAPYCEYEMLVFKGDSFLSENEQFNSESALVKVILKFSNIIVEASV